MLKLHDRIKEISYTIGTGQMFLTGAAPSFSSFSSVLQDGDSFFYCITDGTGYEIGVGIWNSGPNSITRSPANSSMPGDALVDWNVGLKEIYITYPATNSVHQGSGIGFDVPQSSGVAFWEGGNTLNYDSNFLWNKSEGLLNILGDLSVLSGIQSDLVTLNTLTFPGGSQTEPFSRTDLIESTDIDDLLFLSGIVDQQIGLNKQTAGHVFAGPPETCGTPPCPDDYPVFRPLVGADLPPIDAEDVSLFPNFPTDWTLLPTNVEEGFDYLAAQIKVINSAGSGYLVRNLNLGDLQSAETARDNLGLGLDVLSGINTGDQDLSHLLVKSANLSDLTDVVQARINLGVDPSGTINLPPDVMFTYDNLSGLADNEEARNNLGVDPSGTDNSTNVTLVGAYDYLTLDGQEITTHQIDLATDVSGNLAVSHFNSGINASSGTWWRGDGTWQPFIDNQATWGAIIGTLSDQTDLQNALDAKEDAFTKNTGFNKNFGNSADTVVEGDDPRLADDRYPLAHHHDDLYYTETELNAGQLDNRYYTETEVDSLFAPIVHNHDDLYYTETEADSLFGSGLKRYNNLSDLLDVVQARINLGVEPSGTDNSTDVTVSGDYDYITISGQQIDTHPIDFGTDMSGNILIANVASGINASALTFWRGDDVWAEIEHNQPKLVEAAMVENSQELIDAKADNVFGIIYDNKNNEVWVYNDPIWEIDGSKNVEDLGIEIFVYNSETRKLFYLKTQYEIIKILSGGDGESGTIDGHGYDYDDIIVEFNYDRELEVLDRDCDFVENVVNDNILLRGDTNCGYVTSSGHLMTFEQIQLGCDVSGNLPTTHLNSGINANSGTFWRGDGTWETVKESEVIIGSSPSSPLIEMYSVRRDGDNIYIDINIGGTVKTVSLGPAS